MLSHSWLQCGQEQPASQGAACIHMRITLPVLYPPSPRIPSAFPLHPPSHVPNPHPKCVRVCMHDACMCAYVYLAEGSKHRRQRQIQAVDVNLMCDLRGHTGTIQALYRLAASTLLHTNPLICLIVPKDFHMRANFPHRLRPVFLHEAKALHSRWP